MRPVGSRQPYKLVQHNTVVLIGSRVLCLNNTRESDAGQLFGKISNDLHVPNASLYAVHVALWEAGRAYEIQISGAKALDALCLEMELLHWKANIIIEFDPFEMGLSCVVKLDKLGFIGKVALL